MCGRYVIRNRGHSLIHHMPTGVRLESFNIAPSQQAPIGLRWVNSGAVQLWDTVLARWGFQPSWTDWKPQINARSEKVATSGLYRKAFRETRCLVPADGFYEWKTESGQKQPYYITPEQEFAFAGIMTRAADEVATFAIITTDASEFMKPLHHRMPVILTPDQWRPWVEAGGEDLLQPFAGELQAWPVNRKVNNPRYNEPDCIEAIA